MIKIGTRTGSVGGLLLCIVAAVATTGCNNDGSNASSSSSLKISGAPATQAAINQMYSFAPVVSDPVAAAAVGFAIQNKPMWATFNTTSGQLEGTPTSADVGSYPGIVISASTPGAQASLAGFTITVLPGGSVVLTWEAPATNTDGSTVADIAGYTVHYGTISSLLTQSVNVNNPATSYTLQNLTTGAWYFAISAYTGSGVDGALSDVISATLN